jgi:hypothetical protein
MEVGFWKKVTGHIDEGALKLLSFYHSLTLSFALSRNVTFALQCTSLIFFFLHV